MFLAPLPRITDVQSPMSQVCRGCRGERWTGGVVGGDGGHGSIIMPDAEDALGLELLVLLLPPPAAAAHYRLPEIQL